MLLRTALLATLIALPACAQKEEVKAPHADMHDMTPMPAPDGLAESMMRMGGDIIGADGIVIGNVNLLGGAHGVLLEATLQPGSLTPGWHGLHLHQVGNCDDIGEFKNSGGHVGMVAGGHGLLNPNGPEGGDLPNIWAAADGSAAMETLSTLFVLSDLSDSDGAALIIHEARDDHMSQPIGGAGGRVACAVIK